MSSHEIVQPARQLAVVPSFAAVELDPGDFAASVLDPADKVVRPVLAILFRVAIGPGADRYAPRFLAFERTGRPSTGWHWPSLLMPSLWAFYRRLWVPGVCFALLRLAAIAAFVMLGPSFDDSSLQWHAVGLLLVVVLPGVVPAALADWLLYRRVRSLVRKAEACSRNASEALAWLSARMPTSESAAVLLSFALMCAGVATLGPSLWARYTEHVVQIKVADTIAAVHWLQRHVEASLVAGESPPGAQGFVVDGQGSRIVEAVDVSPASGRVRVGFGDALPELAGKWILLAPLWVERDRFRWLCIPVDIPAKYLPKACKQR
jgi:hypothetical protein